MNLKKSTKGFTLIEIVIVLAIAALIMVIVFLAVAGAQRSQRDTALRNAAARTLAAAEAYASNNSGNYPANVAAFSTYTVGISPAPQDGPPGVIPNTPNVLYYWRNVDCSTQSGTTDPRKVTVGYWSEVAGSAQCVGN